MSDHVHEHPNYEKMVVIAEEREVYVTDQECLSVHNGSPAAVPGMAETNFPSRFYGSFGLIVFGPVYYDVRAALVRRNFLVLDSQDPRIASPSRSPANPVPENQRSPTVSPP